VPGQVDREHAAPAHELRHDLAPVRAAAAEPVDEQHRLALAADVVDGAADRAPLEVRCSRHPGNVSCDDHGDSGAAGPLIPATTKRATSEPA
jgi:hypothetical protein